MRERVVTASPDTPAPTVAGQMAAENVGSVVVTERDEPLGIVTDRDLAVQALPDGDPTDRAVGELMTPQPHTVETDCGVMELCGELREAGVRRMPVTENGELAGIVTLDDLSVLLAREHEDLAAVVEAESPDY